MTFRILIIATLNSFRIRHLPPPAGGSSIRRLRGGEALALIEKIKVIKKGHDFNKAGIRRFSVMNVRRACGLAEE